MGRTPDSERIYEGARMKDQYKTKKQLIEELEVLRNQLIKPKKTQANRKRAEEALQQSEETFKGLAESANDGIFVTISEGLQAYANKRASEITGYSVAELLKSSIKDLVHPNELEKIMGKYRKRLVGESIPTQYETIIIHKDGKSLPIELTAAKTVWQGKPADLVIIRDITERKQAEEALQQERNLVNRIMETSPVAITMAGRQGKVTFANAHAEKVLGLTKDDIAQRSYNAPAWHITDYEGNPFPDDKLPFQQVMRTGKAVFGVCHAIEWPDGHRVLLSINGAPLRDDSGQIDGAVFAIEDITERKRTEETLKESESRFRNIVDNSKDGIIFFDGKTRKILFGNSAMAELLGCSKEDLVGRSIPSLHPPEEWASVEQEFQKHVSGEISVSTALPVIRNDGSVFYADISSSLVTLEGRSYFSAFFRDITERKRAEEALRESEEKYHNFVERANDGICIAQDVTLQYVNLQMAKMIGYSVEELIGSHFAEHFIPEEIPKIVDKNKRRLAGEDVESIYETALRHKNGSRIDVEINASIITYEGKPTILALFRDITDRKQAEHALRESEERFRLAFENANTGVCLVDLDGNLTRVNNKMCEIFGYTKEELERMTVNDIAHPEDIEKSPSFILKTLRGEIDRGMFEKRYIHKKGHVVTCEVSSSLVRNADGSPLCFISHVHDITDRKRAEAQIERTLRETRVRFEVSQALAGTQTEDEVLDALIQHAGLYPQAFVVIFTLDRRGGELAAIVRRQNPFDSGLTTVVPIGGDLPVSRYTLFGRLSADQSFVSEDVWTDERIEPAGREVLRQTGAASFAMFPLSAGNKCMGLILAMAKPTNYFDEEKQQLFQTLAEQGAVALRATYLREQIRESQQRFKGLVETLSDWIWEIDENGIFTYISPRVRDLLGYEPKELLGKTSLDLMPPEEAERVKSVSERWLTSHQPWVALENTCRHKDGRLVMFETSGAPFFDADGQFKGYRGVDRDITERKKAEEALQKERETSLSILENAPYGVALIDKGGQYIYINPEFTNITGYILQDIPTGKDWFQKAFSDPKDRERMIQVWKEDRSKGKIVNREFSITCKDGKIREIEIRSTFLRDGRAVVVLHDITEQKRAQEKMESLQEQLRQSQKMEAIGRLAGGIAHDFNNLLTIIKGYSQISLIELKEDTPLKGNIVHIHTATDRAADLVRQLLAFSRRQILEMKVWNLNTILTNLHNMLRRLIGEDIELVTLLAEDLGRVKTDLGWIEQAIMNLVVNARDAMPSGGKLTIETGNADLDEAYVGGHVGVTPGRYVMLSVSDTGAGMTPEVRERLFEPFFSTKEKDKGTGLGLSTVYGIVKQSGGDIWVYSEPDKGSTFKIYLPRVDEPLEERREKALGDELLRGSETILLVEDEEEVRKLAVRLLERQGYKVLAASDGDEALLVCEQHKDPIHLMLTDVVMPGMNGHELAKRLESLHPEMKVLYMSGYTDNAIVLHGVLVQGVNYIQKPFTVDALTKKVREVLEQ
jgi:two-component system cell cycle sensor histidine kinase/response regulator CckA